MPFTPLHLGPGMAMKAAAPRHFSLIVFGLTQIAMDVEVLWHIVTRNPPFHRFWHTYLGAMFIAVGAGILGKPASQWIKALWNCVATRCCGTEITVSVPTTWTASLSAAFLGAYSHILLDSLYHSDIAPWQPWSAENPLHGSFHGHAVDRFCMIAGAIGLIWFYTGIIRKKKS